MTRPTDLTFKIVDVGGRMIPMGHLSIGEQVIAYNPHLHPISREGGLGEIPPEEEMPVRVTTYYLGCFQRGALYALQPASVKEAKLSVEAEASMAPRASKSTRRKRAAENREDIPLGSLPSMEEEKEKS